MSPRAWRSALLLVAVELAVVAAIIVAACTGCSTGPAPTSPGAGPVAVPTAVRVIAPLDASFDRWWLAGRWSCGSQTALIVDDLAGHAVAEVPGTPVLDARLAASAYIRHRCPR